MAGGRISVLVSKELQTLFSAIRDTPAEVNKQIRAHTKKAALPIWEESVRSHVQTRLQTRVLSNSARVSVSDTNVMLKSGGVGKLSSGVSVPTLTPMVEFGASSTAKITQRSRKGNRYSRRRGSVVGPPRRNGYVVYPAAKDSIPRLASLWVQTAVRTIHEAFEKGGAR